MSKLSQKEYKTRLDWVGKVDPLWTVQETEIRQLYKMIHASTRIRLGVRDAWFFFFEFQNTNISPNPSQKTRTNDNLIISKKKEKKEKENLLCSGFSRRADYWVKIKENEKKKKKASTYVDLARELRKLWNMKVRVILVMIGALVKIAKSLERELEKREIGGQNEAFQTAALLRSVRILRKSPGNLRKLFVSQTPVKNSANTNLKISQGVKYGYKRGHVKRETEFLIITAENNALSTN